MIKIKFLWLKTIFIDLKLHFQVNVRIHQKKFKSSELYSNMCTYIQRTRTNCWNRIQCLSGNAMAETELFLKHVVGSWFNKREMSRVELKFERFWFLVRKHDFNKYNHSYKYYLMFWYNIIIIKKSIKGIRKF